MTIDTVTLSTPTTSVTMTGAEFDRAVDAITGRVTIPGDMQFLAGDFLAADDLDRLASRLIAAKDEFAFLREWREQIVVLWKRKGGKRNDKAVYGKCQALTGPARHFAGASYLIWLAADHCRGARFTSDRIEALLYHELCHLGPGEEDEETGIRMPPVLVGHDFEGFAAKLREYGMWHLALEEARNAFAQLPLFG